MVSFWPWKSDGASPASFERALSALATKIANTQAKLEQTRSTSRRTRVLSTLYLSFGYLVYTIVLVLVVGWKNMGPWEWAGIAGGPVAIYTVRTLLSSCFNFRLNSLSAKLKDQQSERAKTIQKLKDATKYDSTLELLEKYGGTENKHQKQEVVGTVVEETVKATPGVHRTNMAPPPTANIPRTEAQILSSLQGTSGAASSGDGSVYLESAAPVVAAGPEISAEFAPNAFGPEDLTRPTTVPGGQYASAAIASAAYGVAMEPHWYDRILDLLMGEDEMAAKNRIVLICTTCRLVNGQAPPGTRSLAEMGSWRCMGCGAMNGEAAESKKIVQEVLGQRVEPFRAAESGAVDLSSLDEDDGEDTTEDGNSDIDAAMVPDASTKKTAGRHNEGGRKRRNYKKERP